MDLTSLASLATIIAIPVAIIGWFVSSRSAKGGSIGDASENPHAGAHNASSVTGPGTSISGNIRSGANSVVVGHNASFTINGDDHRPFDEEVMLGARAAMYAFRLKAGKVWRFPVKEGNPSGEITIELSVCPVTYCVFRVSCD